MLNQRNIVTILFLLMAGGGLCFNILALLKGGDLQPIIGGFIGTGIISVLLVMHLRGWAPASRLLLLIMTFGMITVNAEPYLTKQFPSGAFVPPIVAMIVATPLWVVLSGLILYVGLLIRGGFQGVFLQPAELVIYVMALGGMVLTRVMSDRFLRAAVEQRAKAEAALREAGARSAELAESNTRLDAQIAEQRQLLDLIAVLETPALTLAEGVLVVPLMGHIDTRRSQKLTGRLLQTVAEQRARLVVLDIAGVAVLDSGVAKVLTQTIQAVRLLGCEVVLSGISASVAMTMTQMNITLNGVTTVRNPQDALRLAISKTPERPNGAAQPELPGQIPPPPRPRSSNNGSLRPNR